jgi:hypothetical protein
MRIRRHYHLLSLLSLFLILCITPTSGNSHYHHLWAAAFNNPWGISNNNKGSRGTGVKGNGGNTVGNSQPIEKQSHVVNNCKRREEDEEKNKQREENMALMIAGDTAVCNAADSSSFVSGDSACGFF